MSTRSVTHICIVNYSGAQLSAVYGLVDLFETASSMNIERPDSNDRRITSEIISPRTEYHADPPDILILPPSLKSQSNSEEDVPFLSKMLLEQNKRGGLICSICAGAFHLAQSGLLDGRSATTHWALAGTFQSKYPRVKLDTDKLIVDDGDIITAGGVMAWMDLGLKLVDRSLGSAIMSRTARFFLVDPAEREQRYYSGFVPNLTHGDMAILEVQRWLQGHSSEFASNPMLASLAGLGERTFIRRFQAATGLRPTEYIQALRVEKAKELMELTNETIESIAWQIGYEDPGAFRRVFRKIVGLSPRDFRNRFATLSWSKSND